MGEQDESTALTDQTDADARERKREWSRDPLLDLFPRMPPDALERILDICIDKDFAYNFSEAKRWNARRYTSIVVAHVRHNYSDYDKLLREEVERYEARRRSSAAVWKVLRLWCPWDDSNDVLRRCFEATLLPPEARDSNWDPMDVDSDSDEADFADDPMDLD